MKSGKQCPGLRRVSNILSCMQTQTRFHCCCKFLFTPQNGQMALTNIRGAWTIFPIAVKLVFLRDSGRFEDTKSSLEEMRSLMSVLYLFKQRFSAGKFISTILDTIIVRIHAKRVGYNQHESLALLQDATRIIEKGLAHGILLTLTE
jgi:hypothetical protein